MIKLMEESRIQLLLAYLDFKIGVYWNNKSEICLIRPTV